MSAPNTRSGYTRKVTVGNFDLYVTCSFEDGKLYEVFAKVAKEGSTLAGLMDSLVITISLALKSGVKWETLASRYRLTKFDPSDHNYGSLVAALAEAVDTLIKANDA